MKLSNTVPGITMAIAATLIFVAIFEVHSFKLKSENNIAGVNIPMSINMAFLGATLNVRDKKQYISYQALQNQDAIKELKGTAIIREFTLSRKQIIESLKQSLKGVVRRQSLYAQQQEQVIQNIDDGMKLASNFEDDLIDDLLKNSSDFEKYFWIFPIPGYSLLAITILLAVLSIALLFFGMSYKKQYQCCFIAISMLAALFTLIFLAFGVGLFVAQNRANKILESSNIDFTNFKKDLQEQSLSDIENRIVTNNLNMTERQRNLLKTNLNDEIADLFNQTKHTSKAFAGPSAYIFLGVAFLLITNVVSATCFMKPELGDLNIPEQRWE